eukprot:TRINITY_DN7911_c0_g1_i2.p1 TRINITY_DN7911_c0_g1~~TRINITY_DN7911_c0_g1_i2.p1  ORF type:complete len:459 (-),score=150.72 TRINITY_DN7911_c0_g1_i2:620-1996(-)
MPTVVDVSPSSDSTESSSSPESSRPATAPVELREAAIVDDRFYQHWTPRMRMRILVIGASATLLIPITDTFYLPSLTVVKSDLATTATLVSATVSVFTLVVGVMPLFWGPLTDFWGRKNTMIVSMLIYAATCLACIWVPDIYTMIVFRFFQALGCSSAVAVGSGMLADVIPPSERGFAFGIFGIPTLLGPILGPLIGGSIAHSYGWRSGFILLAALAVAQMLVTVFFVPETLWYIVQKKDRAAIAQGRSPDVPLTVVSVRQDSVTADGSGGGRELLLDSISTPTALAGDPSLPSGGLALPNLIPDPPGTAQTTDSSETLPTAEPTRPTTIVSATIADAPAESYPEVSAEPCTEPVGPDGFPDIPKPKMLPPWLPLAFLREPKTAFLAWMSACAISCLYLTVIVYPVLLSDYYGLDELVVGVCFVPAGVIALGGSISGGLHAGSMLKAYPGLLDSQIGC